MNRPSIRHVRRRLAELGPPRERSVGDYAEVALPVADAAAGLDGFYELIEEESQIALPRLVIDGDCFDAAFVDGSHKFHNVFVDLFYLQRLVAAGGLIVLDDCTWPSVATAVDYFVQNLQWEHAQLPVGTRLTAFHLPDPPADPPFDEFRPFGHRRDGFG